VPVSIFDWITETISIQHYYWIACSILYLFCDVCIFPILICLSSHLERLILLHIPGLNLSSTSVCRIHLSIIWSPGTEVMNSLVFVHYGRFLFLLHLWRTILLDKLVYVESYFLSMLWIYHSMASLLWEFLMNYLLLIWWIYLYMWLVYSTFLVSSQIRTCKSSTFDLPLKIV
jgi:hypothetical protein